MLSKEEIERAKERFNKSLIIEKYSRNIGTPVYISDIKVVLEYINQLEAEKKEVIEKIEKDIEDYRKEMNQTNIKLNQIHYMKRIEYAKEILKIMKGKNK